jgi:hypothetical protein
LLQAQSYGLAGQRQPEKKFYEAAVKVTTAKLQQQLFTAGYFFSFMPSGQFGQFSD